MDKIIGEVKSEELQEVKSLRWLANQFPEIQRAEDDVERMVNCIHLYCSNGADLIEHQKELIDSLTKDQETFQMKMKQVQVETVKKFAQMLREKKYGGTYPYVLLSTIDELEQEMVGEIE